MQGEEVAGVARRRLARQQDLEAAIGPEREVVGRQRGEVPRLAELHVALLDLDQKSRRSRWPRMR
jgi:hypothetical protein